MEMRKLGNTGLTTAPLVLGGNVFGWTIDEETSFAILDAALEAGINAIDTADVYNRFFPPGQGGESETIIGKWMKDRGVRDRVIVITKGGLPMGEGMQGLGRDYLPRACEASLRRLQTDYIDVYMAHQPDAATPIGETLETFQALIDAGKARHAAASNYNAEQMAQALAAAGSGRARFTVVEPHFNLAKRDEYEGALEDLCVAQGMGVIPFFSLASGFLTGKYRTKEQLAGRAREFTASGYFNERNMALLDRIERIAQRHGATMAQVSLAWLIARPSVTAPIVSATSLAQLHDVLGAMDLRLNAEEIAELIG
jgi:aryl-alcohol dehydrogenase-like predicted oxidoreductase